MLLHEIGGNLESFDSIAPALSERFRVLRYDQRGAGLSEKVRREFSLDTQVDDLEAARKEARKAASAPGGPDRAAEVLGKQRDVNGIAVVAYDAGEMAADDLLQLSDRVKQKAAPAAVVLGVEHPGRAEHLPADQREVGDRPQVHVVDLRREPVSLPAEVLGRRDRREAAWR